MLNKAKWLAKEAQLRIKYMTSKDCIFCKIIKGEIKSKPILENKTILAIGDANPIAEVHILIIPKRHIESVMSVGESDSSAIIDMFDAAQKLIRQKDLKAFRLAFNGGSYQHVPHLHWHLLAGRKIEWSKL